MKLTANFDLKEFACRCCGLLPAVTDDFKKFVNMLQDVRNLSGMSLVISSGIRCKKHNAEVGGASNSAHLRGLAADIRCNNSADRLKLIKASIQAGFERIGISDTFIHLDIAEKSKGIWLYS